MTVPCPDTSSTEPPRAETIEELFAALESPLLSYALRLLGDRSLAEDTVQEAFMKLHVQFAEVREPRHWLYRTVHNVALNHRRKSGKIVPLGPAVGDEDASGSVDASDPLPLPDEQIARWEGIGLVRLSLQSLDERSRNLIRLKFIDELSYKEISLQTGLSVTHVGYLLHHAIKAVAAELAKSGVVP